jgi:hypothetical protein
MRGSKDGGGCHAMDWCWTWEAVPDLPSSKWEAYQILSCSTKEENSYCCLAE